MRFSYLNRFLALVAVMMGLFNLTSCSSALEAGTDDTATICEIL